MVDTMRHCAAPGCATVLVKKPHETWARYNNRQTCCRACHGALRFEVTGHPPCVVCGAEMKRKTTESGRRYTQRLTCSQTCSSKRNSGSSALIRKQRHGTPRFFHGNTDRLPSLDSQPKGCASIAEFLAKGGVIQRIEPTWKPEILGVPVRSKIGWNTGRVP